MTIQHIQEYNLQVHEVRQMHDLQVHDDEEAEHHDEASDGRVEVDDAEEHREPTQRVHPVQPIIVADVLVVSATLSVHSDWLLGCSLLVGRLVRCVRLCRLSEGRVRGGCSGGKLSRVGTLLHAAR